MSAHEAFAEHREVKTSSNRGFGLTVGGILLVIAGVRWWLGHGPQALNLTFDIVGAILVTLGVVAPAVLAPLNRWWTKLGLLLAAIVNPLVMLAMFAFIFVPVALVMRLIGRDALRRRTDAAAQSYWIVRDPPGPKPEGMANQF